MRILLSVLVALASTFLTVVNAFALSSAQPPTEDIVKEDFAPLDAIWQPVSGQWAVSNGTYGDSFAGATDISRITSYDNPIPADPQLSELSFPELVVRARVRNFGFDDTHHVGVVYGYQDAQNYYEVIISAVGHLRVRTVMNGVAVDDQPDFGGTACTREVWCEIEVRWKEGVTTVKVNGQSFFQPLSQAEFTHGQVGVVTHSAVGRFDKVFVGIPFGDQAFLETFDGQPSVTFTPQSGQWSVVNGSYRNSAIQQTAVTLSPIRTGFNVDSGDTSNTRSDRACSIPTPTRAISWASYSTTGQASTRKSCFRPRVWPS